MTLQAQIRHAAQAALAALFPDQTFAADTVSINQTRPGFEGDYTVVLFPFVKALRQKPDAIGNALGDYLLAGTQLFSGYKIVSGFLNLSVKDEVFTAFLLNHYRDETYGSWPQQDHRVMVEYSSPNTNKPLHFGHLRNIFLGDATARILHAAGHQVVKANLINDRGIHICKSMIAWQRYAGGATPESAGTKGDHLVGDYYVKYNDVYKQEMQALMQQGLDEKTAGREAPIFKEAQDMLLAWENGDPDVYALWQTMNGWVYEGFNQSYQKLGITFDATYYESNTYLLGKNLVQQGLRRGVLYQKEDGSIWIDLTEEGLDHKLLLRADGTSVYMTQDLGTAVLKHNDYQLNQSIYVIADEQNYHMQVLQLILKKLEEPAAAGIHHLSYGMVELPTGKMKSREGTVVDADDMVAEMTAMAQAQTEAAGKTEGFSATELSSLYEMIGLGALKFYLLRVEPKKKMVFDPKESIDLHGFTATFIQYAHARICSILRRAGVSLLPAPEMFQHIAFGEALLPAEKELLTSLEQYPDATAASAAEYNPSLLAQYAFGTAQLFNSFYDKHSIAQAETEEKKALRIMLIVLTAAVLRHSMGLLGIRLPEKM